jgi:hypothetical protein
MLSTLYTPTAARHDRPTGRLDVRWQKILVALALSVVSEIATWVFVRGYGYWVLGQSLGLRSLCRWDCFWYGSIVLYGYDAVPSRSPAGDAANWAFYPLFPLLAGLWHRLAGFGFEDSLIITGTLALPVCIYLFIEFVDEDDIAVSPWVSGSLVAFGPYALYAHTGYSEPLYFALCTGALLALRRNRWLAAGLLAAACSATRLVGVFLVLPMLAQLVGRGDRVPGPSERGARLEPLLAIALVPLGVTLFGWYLYGRSGDMLAFAHIQVAWGRSLQNPLVVWWQGFHYGGWPRVFALQAGLALLAAAYLCASRRIGYGAYLAAAVMLPLCSSVWSIPRYVFWQPVFLLVLADLVRWPPLARILLPLLWAGYFLMIAAGFSGQRFVV